MTRTSEPAAPRPIALSAMQRRRANLFRWFSPKANRVLDCESYLEFRHLLWREVDPHILALCERPSPRIQARIHGQSLTYTFDAWIRRRDGQELFIEVKPRARLEGQEPRPPRWDLVRAWCDAHALLCDWVTDEHLAAHSQLLDNWEQLLPFACAAHKSVDEGVREAVRALFEREPSLTLSSIPGFLLTHDSERVIAEVIYLLYRGELRADLAGNAVSRALVIERAAKPEDP